MNAFKKKLKKLHLDKLSKRQVQILIGSAGIIALGIALILAYRSGRFNPQASILDNTQAITATSKVQYCTAGEDTSTCNPGQLVYSGTALSNTVSTSIQKISAFCFQYKLDGRTATQAHPSIDVKVVSSDGNILASQAVAGDTSGKITAPIAANASFAAGQTYTAVLKPSGFLARKVAVSNADTACTTLTDDKTFIYGDLNNDNKITISDLSIAIRAYNGDETDTTKAAFNDQKPSLSNLVRMIRSYNETPQGEQ